jgi:hypothetical protein
MPAITTNTTLNVDPENPSQLPIGVDPAVLWTISDALVDPTVSTTSSNPNRPNLNQIVRHRNGDVVDAVTYGLVCSSAYNVVKTMLWPLNSMQPDCQGTTGKNSPGMKSFYKTYFPQQWEGALQWLEKMQPLLTLCIGHYKAEAALQNILDTLRLQGRHGKDGIVDDEVPESPGKRPCRSPSTSRSPKRNRTGSSASREATVDLTQCTYSSSHYYSLINTFQP